MPLPRCGRRAARRAPLCPPPAGSPSSGVARAGLRPALCLLAACSLLAALTDAPRRSGAGPEPATSGAHADDPADHNCRFWALIGAYPDGLIEEHLVTGSFETFQQLGATQPDGWGFVAFAPDSAVPWLRGPVERRERVTANNPFDPDFGLLVEELAGLRPKAVLGHVRNGTTAHLGIPDPHPFLHRGAAFAHNGTVPDSVLLPLLIADGPLFLAHYPPEYVTPYIDSELYFLWILKCAQDHPEQPFTQSLAEAVAVVYSRLPARARLNFVLSRGDTLWALRSYDGDEADPVRFYPLSFPDPSDYWAVCSEIVGSDSTRWGTIPPHTLGVFVPGQRPEFHPIDLELAAVPDPDPRPDAEEARPRPGRGAAYPNPARAAVALPAPWPVPEGSAGRADLQVWDASGALVWSGPAGLRPGRTEGFAEAVWAGRDGEGRPLPSGTYFCRLRCGGRTVEHKITLLR